MGKKAKSSRKGKKAWRANISTEDVHEFFEKTTKDALSGGSVNNILSDSLFIIDKSRDLSAKRKIDKHREKAVRCNSILQKNPFVKALPTSIHKKCTKRAKYVKKVDSANGHKPENEPSTGTFNIWDQKGENNKARRMFKTTIPALEIEPSGCSFNPSFESHQDSLAQAVAEEMQKVYRNELGPQPVPVIISGEAVDEENMYFLDADDVSDDEANMGNLIEDGHMDAVKRPYKQKVVTRVIRNKRARRREQQKAEEKAKKIKKLSNEIDCLPEIIQQIGNEDKEKQKRLLRRTVAKQERLKLAPPRLGRNKFRPAPQQVLLSEEINGSLRKLKGCRTLVRDRYKNLEKRGLVVPTPKTCRR